jgi:hypothetical protein
LNDDEFEKLSESTLRDILENGAFTPMTTDAVKMLLEQWTEPDRSNLLCFLESASLIDRLS